MTRSKTIQLYLIDGVPKGRIKCTLANWTGIAYKIPRIELDKAKSIDYLKQSGVYFLFSTSDETQENIVYIGQAGNRKNGEGILNRLQEHKRNPDKDYWTEASAKQTSEGIVLLKGSHIEIIDSTSIPEKIRKMRQKDNLVIDGILQENTLFTSPTYAAAFVIGGHINGKNAWKDEHGRSLNEIEKSE